jgi:hypothetical protein
MRLLNTKDLSVTEFAANIPKYATLSHTWEVEEVMFADIQNLTVAENMRGFAKIQAAARIARSQLYDWIWIDTCCIDKTSSAELSEAINSMFAFYKNAGLCIAYLSDVNVPGENTISQFIASRWFTRGWTLQELIAPKSMLFFSQEWNALGSKSNLIKHIHSASKVDEYILGGGDVSRISMARRMFWASARATTRVEDMAYCLLGIFNVHMPLLYGEGLENAFLRLQKEILKISDDQSLFAWAHSDIVQGLLARNPSDFQESEPVSALQRRRRQRNLAVQTTSGLQMQLLTASFDKYHRGIILDCQLGPELSTFPVRHLTEHGTIHSDGVLTEVRFANDGEAPDQHGMPSPGLEYANREVVITSGRLRAS